MVSDQNWCYIDCNHHWHLDRESNVVGFALLSGYLKTRANHLQEAQRHTRTEKSNYVVKYRFR